MRWTVREDRRGTMRLGGGRKEMKLVMEGKWKTGKGGRSSMEKSEALFS